MLPTDGPDEQLQKATLTLSSILITLLAFIWVGTYFWLGLSTQALIPLTYQVVSVVSLLLFVRTKRFAEFRASQLALMLGLPFILSWSLGGFRSSSLVCLWAFFAPAGAFMFGGARSAVRWFIAFAALIAVSAVLDPYFAAHAPPIPESVNRAFFIMNFLGPTGTTFLLLFYFASERDRIHSELEAEQQRSERLLLNVLPKPIAQRLKRDENPIADRFEAVTVLFADIVGFTPLSATMPPDDLVALLNQVFTRFDRLADRHGLEKIKTIGDAYMVAGGVPSPRPDHAEAVCGMALDMVAELAELCKSIGRDISIRIGIDSGPAVAGVIGERKFIYDLWGDTVNSASRMESQGTPGAIQITERTRTLLRDGYRFSDAVEREVKGKGKMVTYLLLGAAPGSPETLAK